MTTEAILEILGIVFAAGVFYAKLDGISKDVRRLEKEQKKYNDLQMRTHDLEMWKQYHEEQHKAVVNNELNTPLYH